MLSLSFIRRHRDVSGRDPAAEPGCASHILIPLRAQAGAQWTPHARRALEALPRELSWAAPLLDPEEPMPVLCDRARAEELMRWHNHLPSRRQVLFASRKRRPAPPPLAA